MRRERAGGVAGIVLAAGSSTRMGKNKLLLPLGGSTVLRRAVATILSQSSRRSSPSTVQTSGSIFAS